VAHCVHRKGTREESSRVLITDSVPCNCVFKVSYGIQYCHDLAINGVFDLCKFSNPERWKLRLLETSRDTGSFICQFLSNAGNQSNGSRQELKNDEDGGQGAFLDDHDDGDGDGGQAEVLRDIDNDGNTLISTEAQFFKTRPLIFKNFIDYCHDFAPAVWKQSEPDRLLYAGLIIGLTQDARGDIGSAGEDLQVILQQHRAMFSSRKTGYFCQ
jgi:hypothetical protein